MMFFILTGPDAFPKNDGSHFVFYYRPTLNKISPFIFRPGTALSVVSRTVSCFDAGVAGDDLPVSAATG